MGQRTRGVAILGPENETIKKDPSWVVNNRIISGAVKNKKGSRVCSPVT
uniref:Uncharacterized protein n=1 Tax=Anguilla anguilla TaxID=7936 RepID=A0A0E9WEV7_ANGAN